MMESHIIDTTSEGLAAGCSTRLYPIPSTRMQYCQLLEYGLEYPRIAL